MISNPLHQFSKNWASGKGWGYRESRRSYSRDATFLAGFRAGHETTRRWACKFSLSHNQPKAVPATPPSPFPSLPFPPCPAFLIHTPQPGCDQAEPLPFLPCPRRLASPHDPSSHAHSSLPGLPLPPYLKCQSDPSPTPPNRLTEYLLCALRTQYWN